MKRFVINISFLVYLFLIFYLTIINRLNGSIFIWNSDITYYMENYVNLIPFKSIFYIIANFQLRNILLNILGNLILFMPLAFYLPYVFKKQFKTIYMLLIFILSSVFIEIIQLITLTGSLDIDDVFLNTLGGIVAYKILNLTFVKKLRERFDLKKFILISIVFLIIIGGFYWLIPHKSTNSILIDKRKLCFKSKELIFSDEYTNYYFKCPEMILIKINNKRYPLKKALTQKLIEIDKLKSLGLEIEEKNKYESINLKIRDKQLISTEGENKDIIELLEEIKYDRFEQKILNVYVKPLKEGKTTFNIIIENEENVELKATLKYEVIVAKDLTVTINSIHS